MKLHKLILTENNCYKAGKKIKVKGLMLHSTGANNPKLSRYVGPDDGVLGHNKNNNHWNQPTPDGRNVCVHGFIGNDKDGNVRTYQTLPWNHRGWGGGGKSNDTHIHVEICEDGLTDKVYFNDVYNEAVELFAYLCREFNLTEKDIIDHSEGFKLGIASNHGDVKHWFSKHGRTMDSFRADVRHILNGTVKQKESVKEPVEKPFTPQPVEDKTIDQLARDVIDGKLGNGDNRKKQLGDLYSKVQARVNELLGSKESAPKPALGRSIQQLAQEVIDGKHGSGEARKKSLGDAYDEVQKRVNDILGVKNKKNSGKTISQLADEVVKGLHGTGRDRMRSLGENYTKVQQEVNRRLRGK